MLCQIHSKFKIIQLTIKLFKDKIIMSQIIKRELARQKQFNSINQSTSKMQYSFGKAARFQTIRNNSMANTPYYTLQPQLSKRYTSFSKAKRLDLSIQNQCPPPNNYSINQRLYKTNSAVFACGRNEAKYGSMLKDNKNPPPGAYNPQDKPTKIAYSIGKQIKPSSKKEKQTVGPKYLIPDTINDQYKVLSKYMRRNSTKIVKPSNHSRIKTQFNEFPSPCSYNLNYMTSKGSKKLGNGGRGAFMTTQKRLRSQMSMSCYTPGPGHYNTFSDFIDEPLKY